MIRFIAEHKDHQVTDPATGGVGLVWGVEPMCAVLSEHGVKISPSTYYEWVAKKPTRRQLRDEEIVTAILQLRERNKLNKRLGSRKMWIKLRGEGHDVARWTIERLYRENGWEGARYGSHKTTRPDENHDRHPGPRRPGLRPVRTEPLVGCRLHVRADLDRDGLRGVRDRRVRSSDHRLACRQVDEDGPGSRCARACVLHPRPGWHHRPVGAREPQRCRQRRRIQPVVATPR